MTIHSKAHSTIDSSTNTATTQQAIPTIKAAHPRNLDCHSYSNPAAATHYITLLFSMILSCCWRKSAVGATGLLLPLLCLLVYASSSLMCHTNNNSSVLVGATEVNADAIHISNNNNNNNNAQEKVEEEACTLSGNDSDSTKPEETPPEITPEQQAAQQQQKELVSHATLILPNSNEQVTIELTDDILQRIHDTLQQKGVLGGKDTALIQQLAMEEVHKWHQENEQAQQSRELLLEQRRLLPEQPEKGPTNGHHKPTEKPVFPYPLTLPPPPSLHQRTKKPYYNLDFVKTWTPAGGGRYAEYAAGLSPYRHNQTESDDIARRRRPYIQQAMQHAWNGYRQYAFGYDEVRPVTKKGTNHWGGIGVTLVDSLDTLWIMNMHEEFQQARDWVRDTLSHDQNAKVSVFETTIRSLGGLLSAYDWSRDVVFLEEALDLARRLMRAFVHPIVGDTILPFGEVNLQDGSCNMIPWAGGNAILSEFGTLQIEFRYLDEVVQTSETRGFREKVEGIFELLHEMSPENGLFPYYMKTDHNSKKSAGDESETGDKNNSSKKIPYFTNDHLTFGAMADSFYEYMLKLWIQGGKSEPMYRTMYDKAMQGMHDELLHISTPSGLLYLADKVGVRTGSNKKRIKHKMDHLVCFVGGMLALGAYSDPLGLDSPRAQRDLQTAKVRFLGRFSYFGLPVMRYEFRLRALISNIDLFFLPTLSTPWKTQHRL